MAVLKKFSAKNELMVQKKSNFKNSIFKDIEIKICKPKLGQKGSFADLKYAIFTKIV